MLLRNTIYSSFALLLGLFLFQAQLQTAQAQWSSNVQIGVPAAPTQSVNQDEDQELVFSGVNFQHRDHVGAALEGMYNIIRNEDIELTYLLRDDEVSMTVSEIEDAMAMDGDFNVFALYEEDPSITYYMTYDLRMTRRGARQQIEELLIVIEERDGVPVEVAKITDGDLIESILNTGTVQDDVFNLESTVPYQDILAFEVISMDPRREIFAQEVNGFGVDEVIASGAVDVDQNASDGFDEGEDEFGESQGRSAERAVLEAVLDQWRQRQG